MGDAGDPAQRRPVALDGLEGRVVLVAGAGAGIGLATARAFAEAGASVAVNVRRDASRAVTVAKELRDLGVEAVAVVGDVSEPDAVERVVGEVEAELGTVEVLVHCVGTRPHQRVVDTSDEVWRHVLDTNCSSFFYLARRVLPSMIERRFGRLIAISGPNGRHPVVDHGAIGASKAAMTALARTIALENGEHGVTANLVSPTITETIRTEPGSVPMELAAGLARKGDLAVPRPGTYDEIAFACLFLASTQGAYVTGHTLPVDGGFRL